MEKILVSACFLGKQVRYDGGCQLLNSDILIKWQQQGRLIAICPEVEGGLPVPRAPAEIVAGINSVITEQGDNVTAQFDLGANKALSLCKQHNIKYALLKESSPSCGSSTVYDGTFKGNKIVGMGVTAALLNKSGIKVYSEKNIIKLSEEIKKPISVHQ